MSETENPAEALRRAAALMRERAEAATPSPWSATVWGVRTPEPQRSPIAPFDGAQPDMENRLHIASWHPTVALAVADLLALQYDHAQGRGSACESCVEFAARVAHAYLGTRP